MEVKRTQQNRIGISFFHPVGERCLQARNRAVPSPNENSPTLGWSQEPKIGRAGPRGADARPEGRTIRSNEARPIPSWPPPLFIAPALLGRHQRDLLEGIGGRRLLGHERQLEVTDDPVDDRVIGQERHDLHRPSATGAD